MSDRFEELVAQARAGDPVFGEIPTEQCVQAARERLESAWRHVRERHDAGESGSNAVRMLAEAADGIMRGLTAFGVYHTPGRWSVMKRVSICALGGYGRLEMSPKSDLDLCVLYNGRLNSDIKRLNEYLVPFLWDMGFQAGHTIHSVREAVALSKRDPEVFTTYLQARKILGDNRPFARLRQQLENLRPKEREAILRHIRKRENPEDLPAPHRDLFALEPNVKENMGGLRDFHAAQWIIRICHGPMSLDDLAVLKHISPEEHLEFATALGFIRRIRNDLHFVTGRDEDQLSFELQEQVSTNFGYGEGGKEAIEHFMRDYYNAAQRLRGFLRFALRFTDNQPEQMDLDFAARTTPSRSKVVVYRGQLCSATLDRKWFAESPPRLMELFWEAARRRVPLSHALEGWVRENLSLAETDSFRTSDVVRRYFVAICSRPPRAGHALRQAAEAGLLDAYLPEFAAVRGILRYEDFHSYPVDEHTLRAVESLADIPGMGGSIGRLLQRTLEHIRKPHVLVMAILMHDLGKAAGEIHVRAGVDIARQACSRIGLPQEDNDLIAFLAEHHMLMSNIAFYRDTNDIDIVNGFVATVKSDERLQLLLLLTYADLAAVAPDVWNEWKGALLLGLFLRAERVLSGRAEVAEDEEYWNLPKAREVAAQAPAELKEGVEAHLRAFGEGYFIAFSPKHIVRHMACLGQARRNGLAVRCDTHRETGMSEVVVCTNDRPGLFSEIAGVLAAQLVDVEGAALFTGPDGMVVDCFTVRDAASGRPLSKAKARAVDKLLREVLRDGKDVGQCVDQSRQRLFALLQPRVPVPTGVKFDNTASGTDTVIDIETGDRTGLLYDMARALTETGVDILSARIMTDARRVCDAFYVRMGNGKITDNGAQEAVRRALSEAVG